MRRLMIFFAVGFSLISIASSQSLDVVEGAAELSLSDMTFPNTAGGMVIYTECDACEPVRMQVDSQTVYIGLAGAVPLADFLADVSELRTTEPGQQTFVSLFYDLNSNRVTRIRLHPEIS